MAFNLALSAFRDDPLALRFAVTGYDLTNSNPCFAVRQYRDAPGAPLLQLAATSTRGADGTRIVGVTTDSDGVPTTLLEVIGSKALMQSLPAAPEIGSDLTLAYDLQWTPPDDGSGFTAEEETQLFGDFIVKGSVNA